MKTKHETMMQKLYPTFMKVFVLTSDKNDAQQDITLAAECYISLVQNPTQCWCIMNINYLWMALILILLFTLNAKSYIFYRKLPCLQAFPVVQTKLVSFKHTQTPPRQCMGSPSKKLVFNRPGFSMGLCSLVQQPVASASSSCGFWWVRRIDLFPVPEAMNNECTLCHSSQIRFHL